MGMLAKAANMLHQLETYAGTSTTGAIATVETLRNDLEGDYAQSARDAIQEVTGAVARPLTKANVRRIVDPILRQTALAIEHPNPSGPITDIVEALYDYMIANSQTINDCGDTYDTSWSAGGSNVGNATVQRLTVDENNEVLGGFLPDTGWTLTCVQDARTLGDAFRELWTLEGTAGRTDNLDVDAGTNLIVRGIRTLSAADTTVVRNPTFSDYTLDGSDISTLNGWTQNTGSSLSDNLSINTTYYLKAPGDTTNSSLQFDGDETIYQDLVATAGARFRNDPYEISIGVAKVGTPTGTIGLRLSGTIGSGGVSATLAHGAMTGSGTFDRLRIAVGQNSWPASWNVNDLKLQVSLASSGSIDASNYFVVDDIIFAPMQRIGRRDDPRSGRGAMGQYLSVVRGETASVKDDVYTAGDTVSATRGEIHWLFSKLGHYGYLPLDNSGTETVSDE